MRIGNDPPLPKQIGHFGAGSELADSSGVRPSFAITAVAIALAACALPSSDGESIGAAESADSTDACEALDFTARPPTNLPLGVYYSYFRRNGVAQKWNNERLVIPGMETVFVVGGCEDPEFAVLQKSARVAHHVSIASLAHLFDLDAEKSTPPGTQAAALLGGQLTKWDYVAVDEIPGGRSDHATDPTSDEYGRDPAYFQNGGKYEAAMVGLLAALPKRILVYLRMAPTAKNTAAYGTLFDGIAKNARALLVEVYPGTPYAPATAKNEMRTSGVVATDVEQDYETLAATLDATNVALRKVMIPVIGASTEGPGDKNVTRYLDVPRCDLAPFRGKCRTKPTDPKRAPGGLAQQMGVRMRGAHAKKERAGIAFYTFAHVFETKTHATVWTRADLSRWACLEASLYVAPDQRGPARARCRKEEAQ